jgi:hypothetical protein
MRNIVGAIATIIFAVILFFTYRLKLVERIMLTIDQSPNGKNWQNEVEKQKKIYTEKKDIIFIGDSHIEQCEWQEVFPQYKIGNRGIGGETSGALLTRIENAVLPGTSVAVLQIGVNDILSNIEATTVIDNYSFIIKYLKKNNCKIVATLPFLTRYYPDKNRKIQGLGNRLLVLFNEEKITNINLNPTIAPEGELLLEYSSDGVHLNAKGYSLWIEQLKSKLTLN